MDSKKVNYKKPYITLSKKIPRFVQGFAHMYPILCSSQMIILNLNNDLACGTTTKDPTTGHTSNRGNKCPLCAFDATGGQITVKSIQGLSYPSLDISLPHFVGAVD